MESDTPASPPGTQQSVLTQGTRKPPGWGPKNPPGTEMTSSSLSARSWHPVEMQHGGSSCQGVPGAGSAAQHRQPQHTLPLFCFSICTLLSCFDAGNPTGTWAQILPPCPGKGNQQMGSSTLDSSSPLIQVPGSRLGAVAMVGVQNTRNCSGRVQGACKDG